ncbi:MAG: epoxyqueuosine reductase QueH [Lactobacillales bacterium]|nr:epoxyqueuosine reductase QueH [Lactobacillales bacterium]
MKIDYQKKMEEILNTITKPKRLLLHSCCAPCSSYVLLSLTKYFDITIFYYNPNITEEDEFKKRLNEQIKLVNEITKENKIDIIEGKYEKEKFESVINGLENELEGGARCFKCYRLRMGEAAKIAKELKYDYFTTTLSISPYKNAPKLNEIGEELEKEYNVKYLYADFKKKDGYKKSIELSKKYNLYRQDYCGCIYSKRNNIDD